MYKRSFQLFIIFSLLLLSFECRLNAAEIIVPAVSAAADSTITIDKNNQMMLVFVERLKSGNTKEARKIAQEMADFSNNYKLLDKKYIRKLLIFPKNTKMMQIQNIKVFIQI